eukprot:351596-Chlamydomonas_euryale.AAC.12
MAAYGARAEHHRVALRSRPPVFRAVAQSALPPTVRVWPPARADVTRVGCVNTCRWLRGTPPIPPPPSACRRRMPCTYAGKCSAPLPPPTELFDTSKCTAVDGLACVVRSALPGGVGQACVQESSTHSEGCAGVAAFRCMHRNFSGVSARICGRESQIAGSRPTSTWLCRGGGGKIKTLAETQPAIDSTGGAGSCLLQTSSIAPQTQSKPFGEAAAAPKNPSLQVAHGPHVPSSGTWTACPIKWHVDRMACTFRPQQPCAAPFQTRLGEPDTDCIYLQHAGDANACIHAFIHACSSARLPPK